MLCGLRMQKFLGGRESIWCVQVLNWFPDRAMAASPHDATLDCPEQQYLFTTFVYCEPGTISNIAHV